MSTDTANIDRPPVSSWLPPLAACALLASTFAGLLPGHSAWVIVPAVLVLVGTVFAAVHHAEVIACQVGEPFGTLVLALAVTLIESSLIVSLMLSSGDDAATLARDTVFATVMIVCNGVLGLCLLVGSARHYVVSFRPEGTTPAVAVLATLATLTLVLPQFTLASVGPTYSTAQLVFAGVVSLLLYLVFVFVQTIRHRDFFVPDGDDNLDEHAVPPGRRAAWLSLVVLLIALIGVVGLAKLLAPTIEVAVVAAGMPLAVVGIAIALMVLLPETLSALRAARSGRLQSSMNLGLGSVLAAIGLTIPAVVVVSIPAGLPLVLGLPPTEMVLLALTLLLTAMTVLPGRATVLQGALHLVVFSIFLFLAMVP